MSIYSRRRRFVYSLAMVALLAMVYVGFRVASDTFLDVERNAPHPISQRRAESGSNEAVQLARTWFAHAPWVGEARKQFYDEGRYLYCRDFSLINDDRSLMFSPIAMLWQSDDDRDPVTVVAEKAQLTTTEPLSMNSSEFGKLSRGLISGNVQIQGPDNLKISGRTFQLDQDSMKLFSSDPIRFQYDTHSGVASGGVDVFLSAAADSEGDLTDVDHVTQVQLHGQVSCNFFVPATKPGREDVKLQIIAAGGFTFDVDMKTCTFSGLAPDGRGTQLNPKQEVWVRRIHPDGNFDELVCPELQLHFRNELDPVTGQPIDDKLAIERFTAWGRRVTVASRKNKLIMQGTELHYSLDEGRFDLKHSDLDASGNGQMVMVIRDGITLEVPHVRVLMTEDAGLQRVECLGRGRMFGEPPKRTKDDEKQASGKTKSKQKPSRFMVNWDDELTFRKLADEAWLVDLLGNAVVQESSREFQLKGQQIQVRLEEPSKPAKTMEASSKILQVGHSAAARIPEVEDDFNLSNLVPRMMTAAGNVTMSTPEGTGEVRERLVVKIFDQPLISTASTNDAQKDQPSDGKEDSQKEVSGITFATDRLEAIVHRPAGDAVDQDLQFQSVWLKGAVKIDRKSADPDKQFSAEGTMLQASSTANNDLDLKLFGDPAKLNSAKHNMESTRIDLNQIDANVNAVGSGRIRFQTDKGFDGQLLKNPAPIDIYWSDRMSFEPRSATFVGNIRIAMSDENTQDVEILCSGLKVFFTRDVTLGKSEEDGSFQAFGEQTSDESELIERIECLSKVNVRIDQYDDGQHVGRHRMEMVDLKMNLETGDFHAIGPGFLESASPDKDGALQGATPVTVRPNSPAATSETAFVYVKADFIGDVKGNRKLHMATLSQNVVALIAPTPRVDEQISLDLIPFDQLPLKAGLLRAQQLTLSGTSGDSFSMIARDNARLESQTLSASADLITYDHTKQQFIIRTEGDNEVIAVHRSAPGRPVNRLKGKRFEYYRRTNQLKADGIGGLQIRN